MFVPSRLQRHLRELRRLVSYWPLRLLYNHSARFRSYYWEFRAPDVHAQWGFTVTNFDNIAAVIKERSPGRILDFGCGSGRLWPLYAELAVPEVVGYDVSPKALEICRERGVAGKMALFSGEVSALPFPARYFDLVISNRVLQHVPPKHIRQVLAEVAHYAEAIYLCEMSKQDATSRFFFMFRHDYGRLLAPLGFRMVKQGGTDSVNHWIVFSRDDAAGRDPS